MQGGPDGRDEVTQHAPDFGTLPTEWVEPCEGFQFTPRTIAVTRAFQDDKLSLCGLPPEVFGDSVDPSFFIGLGIRAGIYSGISAEGNVNMLQRLVQHRPARLDEPLTARGRIAAISPVPRGRTVHTDVWFEDAAGERVISAPRTSLKPDPARAGSRGAGERPAPLVDDVEALEHLSTHTLSPDMVKGYSSEGNSIHYDMAAANRAGFRAPLIGGGMGVHFLLAALWARQAPLALDLDIYFRRPVFWDDTFSVAALGSAGVWRALALVRDGKVLTEVRINQPTAAGAP